MSPNLILMFFPVLQGADAMNHHPGPAIATLMKLSFDEEHRHAICTLGNYLSKMNIRIYHDFEGDIKKNLS